jgi:hypothetical protein
MLTPTPRQLEYGRRVSVCVQCPLSVLKDNRTTCTIDGANIIDHAGLSGCPQGRYDTPIPQAVAAASPHTIPLAGDLVASLTARLGIDRVAKFAAKLAGKKDCGCAKRRQWLNRLDQRIRQRLTRKENSQ